MLKRYGMFSHRVFGPEPEVKTAPGNDEVALAKAKAAAEVEGRAEAKRKIKEAERAEKAAKKEAEAKAAPPPPPPGDKKFSQADVDRIIQERLRDGNTEKAKLLEQVAANAKTAEEKAEAERQLEETRKQMMTKEQAAAAEAQKVKSEADARVKAASEEAARVRANYENEKVAREIQAAAVAAKTNEQGAWQLPELLAKGAKVVELKDAEGKFTGKSEVRVSQVLSDGKVMEGTPEQVVAAMKQDVKKFGNLFSADVVGGLGMGAPKTGGENKKLEDMPQDAFNKAFRENPESIGLKRKPWLSRPTT